MKVLMIGGGGFIGAWTAHALRKDGVEVRVLDIGQPNPFFSERNGEGTVEWIVGDVTDTQSVTSAARGCDSIIHMAGVLTPFCRENPVKGAMINVIGTLNAFEAARANAITRVVYTSSGGVYGPPELNEPWPTTHYGAFKLANEGSARAYSADCGITSLGLRPFVVYGPGRETGLTAGPTLACRAAAKGEAYEIPYSGRSGMVYVADVVEALRRGLTASFEGAGVINLTGEDVDMPEIAATINQLAGERLVTYAGPAMPSPSTATGHDGSDTIGRIPVTSLGSGLSQTFSFYANPNEDNQMGAR